MSLWRGRPTTISTLSGGLTNDNFVVESEGKRYVMRLPGQSTELLSIDRENEVYNTKAAASTGIGPRVLEHVPDIDVMVLEFIPGPTMSAQKLQTRQMAARMAHSFHRLHNAPRFLRNRTGAAARQGLGQGQQIDVADDDAMGHGCGA